MPKRVLLAAEMEELLTKGEAGILATVGPDGPYAVAVNYLYWNGKIYFHGRKTGQKMENVAQNPKVSFLVYETQGFRRGSTPCAVTTLYRSVVVSGEAKAIEGETAREVLSRLGAKYSPNLDDYAIPSDKLAITAVVEIAIGKMTGKAGE
jgi:nitroimidazol reductase NimA-like FMN-containing flavoprotein (pyridoxamine 5'-phosphate oxidase superfamily)